MEVILADVDGKRLYALYNGISHIYGGWLLETDDGPVGLSDLEKSGDFSLIRKVNAILSDSDIWREEVSQEEKMYIEKVVKARKVKGEI